MSASIEGARHFCKNTGLLELFPQNYHEPYYSSYTNENFGALAADCDLQPVRNVETFVSKVMVFDKALAGKEQSSLKRLSFKSQRQAGRSALSQSRAN
jgi:hypothetical protein